MPRARPTRIPLFVMTLFVIVALPIRAQSANERAITVHPGVSLDVLDFGGAGPPVVLLAGITHNAHVFAAFAPLLTDHFHVWALTRRGAGMSTPARPGVTLDTLADDIVGILDSLGIDAATLVGHSYGGFELTVFAARYPSRTSALVYVDALYDTGPLFPSPDLYGVLSQAFLPSLPTNPSLEDRRANAGLQGCPFPPEALRAHWVLDSEGRYLRDVADSASTQAIFEAPEVPRHYSAIQAPALVLYPIWRSSWDLPWSSTLPDSLRTRADNAVFLWEALRRRPRAYFASEVPQARFQGVTAAGHCMFMTHPSEVAASIDSFLLHAGHK